MTTPASSSFPSPRPDVFLRYLVSSKVYDKAVMIIERYFGCEDDEEEDERFAPVIAEGGETFSFGATAAGASSANDTPSKSCGMATGTEGLPAFGSPQRALNFA